MINVYAINSASPAHLATVIEEMKKLGAPKIKAVWCGDHYRAVEGSHRLAACAALDLTPEIVEIEEDEEVEHDCDDLPSNATAAELIEYANDMNQPFYSFDL